MIGKLIVCLAGLVFVILGAVLGYKRYGFYRRGADAEGTVVDFMVNADGSWAYIYEFYTYEGKKITAAPAVCHGANSVRRYKPGKKVLLTYDRKKPRTFREKNIASEALPPVLLIAMGILYIFFGIIVM